MYVKETIFTLQ